MKRLFFILFVMVATLMFFNCSENNSTAPDLTQDSPVTLGKVKTDFHATAMIDCFWEGASSGTMKVLPNGKIHQRGVKAKFIMVEDKPTDGLLNGGMFWTTNKNIDGKNAKLWGKIELIGDKGKWALKWHGSKIGLDVVIYAHGVGVEGDVKGMVTKMMMEMKLVPNPESPPPVIECKKFFHSIEGYILK